MSLSPSTKLQSDTPLDVGWPERQLIALSSVALSLVIALNYWGYQLSFHQSHMVPVLKVLALSVCIQLMGTEAALQLQTWSGARHRWFASEAFLTLMNLLLWMLIGKGLETPGVSVPAYLLGAVATFLFVIGIVRYIQSASRLSAWPFISMVLLGTWMCGKFYAKPVQGKGTNGPLCGMSCIIYTPFIHL
jgi:hypothetical protein